MVDVKTCTKCEELKGFDAFCRAAHRRDGLACWCKGCIAQHYQENKARISERSAGYYRTNIAKITAAAALYRKQNAEKLLAFRRRNIERAAEYRKNYYLEHSKRIADHKRKPEQQEGRRSRERRQTHALTDQYVRSVLRKVEQPSTRDFLPELVNLKRVLLATKRTLRAILNATKDRNIMTKISGFQQTNTKLLKLFDDVLAGKIETPNAQLACRAVGLETRRHELEVKRAVRGGFVKKMAPQWRREHLVAAA